jgi:hypothetical protein
MNPGFQKGIGLFHCLLHRCYLRQRALRALDDGALGRAVRMAKVFGVTTGLGTAHSMLLQGVAITAPVPIWSAKAAGIASRLIFSLTQGGH